MRISEHHKDGFQFLLASLLSGLSWMLVPIQLQYLPPLYASGARIMASGLVLVLWALWRSPVKFSLEQTLWIAIQGFFMFSVNYYIGHMACEMTYSGLVALGVSLIILPNALIGYTVMGNRLSFKKICAIGMAVMGVGLLYGQSFLTMDWGDRHFIGFLMAVGSTIFAAIGTNMSHKIREFNAPSEYNIGLAMVLGGFMSLVAGSVSYGPVTLDMDSTFLLSFFSLVFLVTPFFFATYNYIILKYSAVEASYMWIVSTCFAVMSSVIFEGFVPSLIQVVGIVVILFSASIFYSTFTIKVPGWLRLRPQE